MSLSWTAKRPASAPTQAATVLIPDDRQPAPLDAVWHPCCPECCEQDCALTAQLHLIPCDHQRKVHYR